MMIDLRKRDDINVIQEWVLEEAVSYGVGDERWAQAGGKNSYMFTSTKPKKEKHHGTKFIAPRCPPWMFLPCDPPPCRGTSNPPSFRPAFLLCRVLAHPLRSQRGGLHRFCFARCWFRVLLYPRQRFCVVLHPFAHSL